MDKRENPIQKGKLRLEAISEYRSEIYGISIFWILLFHMREHTKFEIFDGIPVLHYLQEVVKRGNMGVDVFFWHLPVFLICKESGHSGFYEKTNLKNYVSTVVYKCTIMACLFGFS